MAPGLFVICKQSPDGNSTPCTGMGEKASYWCPFLVTSKNVFQKRKKL